jgi:hypothetical protein
MRAISSALASTSGLQYFCRSDGHLKTNYQSLSQKSTTSAHQESRRAAPEDWCYVYNFNDADRPHAIKIRRGWGKILKADMEQLVQHVQREAKKMFESDDFAHQRQTLIDQLQKQQQQMMEALMEEAKQHGLALRMTPSGIVLLPMKDQKPMEEADYLALAAAEKKKLEETRGEIEKKVEDTLGWQKRGREISEKLEGMEMGAADYPRAARWRAQS